MKFDDATTQEIGPPDAGAGLEKAVEAIATAERLIVDTAGEVYRHDDRRWEPLTELQLEALVLRHAMGAAGSHRRSEIKKLLRLRRLDECLQWGGSQTTRSPAGRVCWISRPASAGRRQPFLKKHGGGNCRYV